MSARITRHVAKPFLVEMTDPLTPDTRDDIAAWIEANGGTVHVKEEVADIIAICDNGKHSYVQFGEHVGRGPNGEFNVVEDLNEVFVPEFASKYCGGPEDGHLFEVTIRSRGSYKEHGKETYAEADWWGPETTVSVRAWSQREALYTASRVQLTEWTCNEDSFDMPTRTSKKESK